MRDATRQDFLYVPSFHSFRDPHALLARLGEGDGFRHGLEITVVLLLAVQAARLAWLLLPAAGLGMGAMPPVTRTDMQPARLAIDAFHPVRAATTHTDASGLRLFAVRPSPAGGSAILATADGPQRSFAAGDEVAPGVTLAEVQPDHVVLDLGGRRSMLRFPATGRPPRFPTAPPVQTPAAASTAAAVPSMPAVDPAQLLAQMGLRPEQADGRVTGYTVIPRGDGAALRQAGLQAGDVLLSVNNEALDPERHARLGELLGSASGITLTYRRDGRIHTATLQAPTP